MFLLLLLPAGEGRLEEFWGNNNNSLGPEPGAGDLWNPRPQASPSGWQGLQMAFELSLAVITVHLLQPQVPFSAQPHGLGCNTPLSLIPCAET